MVLGLDRKGSSWLDWGRSPALVAAVSVAKTEGYSGRDSNDRLASVPAMAPPSAGISGTLWWLKRPDSPIRPLGPDLLLSLTQEGGRADPLLCQHLQPGPSCSSCSMPHPGCLQKPRPQTGLHSHSAMLDLLDPELCLYR